MAGLGLSSINHSRLVEKILSDDLFALRVRRESPGLTEEAAADNAVLDRLANDPVFFSTLILGLKPTPYQKEFLASDHKRRVLRWPRQSGKSHCLAAIAIWFAASHPKTTTLILAPSWRQSSLLHDKIQSMVDGTPKKIRRAIFQRKTKTKSFFRNGSMIIALPNSENLLRGFTASLILLDEAAFFKNDFEIFQQVLSPMLVTTNGTMIASSTPWGMRTQFYAINNSPRWRVFHATWRDAAEAGVYTKEGVEDIERAKEEYPLSFRMEYEAEFAEDVDTWLTQELLAKSCDGDIDYTDFDKQAQGEFYAGVDLAEVVDYSAIAVIRKKGKTLDLVHMHRFQLGEELGSVLGYSKILQQKWDKVVAVYVDNTKHGNYILTDMKEVGIRNPVGIKFNIDSKQEMAQILRQRMEEGHLRIPYDRTLLNELNVEQYQLTKTGKIEFTHMSGTHDDRFWAIALAVYAATKEALPQRPIARSV